MLDLAQDVLVVGKLLLAHFLLIELRLFLINLALQESGVFSVYLLDFVLQA
jgi:hypothetical protein